MLDGLVKESDKVLVLFLHHSLENKLTRTVSWSTYIHFLSEETRLQCPGSGKSFAGKFHNSRLHHPWRLRINYKRRR